MTEADSLSPAQEEAMRKAWDLLTEHFDRVLLVVDFDMDAASGKRQDFHSCWWHGGVLASLGMAEYAKHRILRGYEPDNEPDDDSE